MVRDDFLKFCILRFLVKTAFRIEESGDERGAPRFC